MKKNLLQISCGLLLALILCIDAAGFVDLRFTRPLEAFCYDLRLKLTMPKTVDSRIAIIDIDDKSLAAEGRWPWSRDRIALLLDNLFDRYHAAVVGFDVVFAERDTSSGINVLERLAQGELKNDPSYCQVLPRLKKRLDYDGLFTSRLKDRPVVLGYYFTGSERKEAIKSGELPPPAITAEAMGGRSIPFVSMKGYGANLPALQRSASGAGHFNPFIDPDGKCRKVPILVEYGSGYYEALSVAMVRTLFGKPPITPVFESAAGGAYDAVEAVQISDLTIPVDKQVCALVPYRGGQGSFRYFSASDVLHGSIPADQLEGAIVLVGTTALGLMDQRSTPVSEVFPGVEIHANMIAGILDQSFRHRPAYARGAEIAVLVVTGILLSLALPFLPPLKSTILAAVTLSSVIGLNAYGWHHNLILPLASSLLLVLALYVFNMTFGFFSEARARSRITGLFGQYIPPELVSEMSHHHQDFTMEGESRYMTVLFSDIRNFTSLSEGMTPKDLSRMMNEYLTLMTRVIQRHRGTIDKYIGDAIMAFWGAPLADEQHARNAVLAAMEMHAEMESLRERFREMGWPELRIGIGISTGVMSVGNMGSEFRRAYTVIGDSVNLGSRLEGLTKVYGVSTIVSAATRAEVEGIVFRELDRVRVKGKEEPVAIFEPVGVDGEVGERLHFELVTFREALDLYWTRQWDESERLMTELAKGSAESPLYTLYLERLSHFRQEPPPSDWDGAFTHVNK